MSRYSGQDKNKTIFPLPPPSSTSAYARFTNPLQPYNQCNLVLSMSIGHRKEIRYPWGILQSAWRLLLIGFPKFCLFCVFFLLGGGGGGFSQPLRPCFPIMYFIFVMPELFSLECRKRFAILLWFCITTLNEGLKKFQHHFFHLMRSNSKTDRHSLAHV